MDEERRRPRKLTPMSGELRAEAGWVPPGPVEERYKPRKEKVLPRTTKEVVLHGLRRLVITLGLLAGATALLAFLLVELAGTSPDRTYALAFIFVGAGLLALAFFHQTGEASHWYWEREEHEVAFNWSTVYALFGMLLVGIGVLLDVLS